MLSTQGLLLLRDIELSFCAGAWLSVIVLSYAVVDATLRDIETGDYKSKAADLYGENEDLDWLRRLRNELVHVLPPGSPSLVWKHSPNDLVACHAALEADACRAVTLAYKAIYANVEPNSRSNGRAAEVPASSTAVAARRSPRRYGS